MRHNEISNILKSTQLIVDNREREEKIKGEKFNIFSILKMETKENGTHSAFLGELLNPNGSHLKGNLYLNLFLNKIGDKTLDRNTTKVVLEKYIGPTTITAKLIESTGGRIDIYLEDNKGTIVSIENKLNAPEQKLQVVRYYNYKKNKNTVYYLTLDEKTPSSYSIDTLKPGDDFHEINYGHHILEWLSECQKESTDNPIIRETIKQYSILLKKLTGQMNDQNKEELYNVILSNYEAAQTITKNITEARKTICQEIFKTVYQKLKLTLDSDKDFLVEEGSDVWNKHSQIWIRPTIKYDMQEERLLNYVLESFSGDGHFNGDLFLGILNPPPHQSKYATPPNELSVYNWIINKKMIPELDGIKINLSDPKTIYKLHTDKPFKTKFIDHIIKETISYLEKQHPNLKIFLKTLKSQKSINLSDNN